LIIVCSL